MNRFIDADALIGDLKGALEFNTGMCNEEQNEYFDMGLKCAIRAIQMHETADVVEVVRCRDCKYCLTDDDTMYCERATGLDQILPDDFCSYGERRKL